MKIITNLNLEMRKRFQCEKCKEKFINNSNLKVHKKVKFKSLFLTSTKFLSRGQNWAKLTFICFIYNILNDEYLAAKRLCYRCFRGSTWESHLATPKRTKKPSYLKQIKNIMKYQLYMNKILDLHWICMDAILSSVWGVFNHFLLNETQQIEVRLVMITTVLD